MKTFIEHLSETGRYDEAFRDLVKGDKKPDEPTQAEKWKSMRKQSGLEAFKGDRDVAVGKKEDEVRSKLSGNGQRF